VRRAERNLTSEDGEAPTAEQIAGRLGTTTDSVERMRERGRAQISLETPVGENGEGRLGDVLEDPNSANLDARIESAELAAALDEALARLEPRERQIIEWRFGLNSTGEELTLDELGVRFNVTRERVRQIEARALAKLRHPARLRRLAPFVAPRRA